MIEDIRALSLKYEQELISIRRHIHANPELSFEEYKTCEFICRKLDEYGIRNKVIGKTGVVGIIEGTEPGSSCTALRADMDALPILEENKIDYCSAIPGVMHACGHDVHTTCLLGAARILSELKNRWNGTVKLIFQPGEEKNPGGASILIGEGVLEDPAPQRIFALHVHPGLETGKFSFRGGMVMASADEIYITLRAKGGHAAAPQFTADPILIASHIVIGLQQIISRNNDPFNPSVLSITSIQGGNTTNVIPSEVKMMGTFRAMNEEWRFRAHELIRNHILQVSSAMSASAEVSIDVGYPFVYNDPELSARARRNAEMLAGKENVSESELRMGAEDFAYYSHKIPACFFRLGAGNAAMGITSNVHTPTFNVDEAAIAQGSAMMAWLAVSS